MKFRIVALPLASSTRPLSRFIPSSSPNSSSRHILYYYHFHLSPSDSPTDSANAQPNLLRKALNKAVQAWNGMGLAPQGNWKRTIYVYGERLMDRIDFEETSLKTLHPPSTRDRGANSGLSIPLIYPSNFPSPLPSFQETILHRTPLHRKGFWTWLLLSPLMTPFAIVPVIPNLPFFFCAWRSWSHHRAWKSSDYLQFLIESGAIRAEASDEFAAVYPAGDRTPRISSVPESESGSINEGTAKDSISEKSEPGVSNEIPKLEETNEDEGSLLLSSERVKLLVERLKLPSRASTEIAKALEQAAARLEKVKAEAKKERE